MSEIQISINSRTLERVFFVFIILALLGLNIYQWTSDDTAREDTTATGRVTSNTQLSTVEEEDAPLETTASAPEATCHDGVKNQDEERVDCGGICGGYWYDGTCNAEPAPECRMNSDCAAGFACESNTCIESPPECVADSDCQSSEICNAGTCEEKELTGNLEAKILSATPRAGVGDDTKKLKDIQLQITNGKSKTLLLYGKAYLYTGRSDPFYEIGKEFDIGSISSGETITQAFTVDFPSFADDGDQRTLRIEFYDDSDELIEADGTLTKTVYP